MSYFIKFFCMICLLSISMTGPIFSDSHNNRAFYAVSSLCFHLNTKLSEDYSEDYFSDSDLAALWDSAATASPFEQEIATGRDLYYRAKEGSQRKANNLLYEAKELLDHVWENLNPLLNNSPEYTAKKNSDLILPENSPLRASLKKIFSVKNVMQTPKTFTNAGFELVSVRSSRMFVASHPALKGHLVKAYTESMRIMPNWQWAVYRCTSARGIQNLIEEKGLEHFVVPDKWIYPLTKFKYDGADLNKNTSPMILVVTDMNIVTKKESAKAWKSKITKRHLQELYCILSHGYSSPALPSNVPYTKDGKFTCIDTEPPHSNFSYFQASRYFSSEMQAYWKYLVKSGGADLPF